MRRVEVTVKIHLNGYDLLEILYRSGLYRIWEGKKDTPGVRGIRSAVREEISRHGSELIYFTGFHEDMESVTRYALPLEECCPVRELRWCAARLTEVYGPDVIPDQEVEREISRWTERAARG